MGSRDGAPSLHGAVRRHRFRFSLGDDRCARFVLDEVACQSLGQRANNDLSWLGSGLQPRDDVYCVASHQELAVLVDAPGRHLAGVHADPKRDGDRELPVEIGERVTHRERRANRPLRVVVVRQRDPEDHHDGVADELLDGPPVGLGDALHSREVTRHRATDELRILTSCPSRRADDVREYEAHELALFGHGRILRLPAPLAGIVHDFGASHTAPGCAGAEAWT